MKFSVAATFGFLGCALALPAPIAKKGDLSFPFPAGSSGSSRSATGFPTGFPFPMPSGMPTGSSSSGFPSFGGFPGLGGTGGYEKREQGHHRGSKPFGGFPTWPWPWPKPTGPPSFPGPSGGTPTGGFPGFPSFPPTPSATPSGFPYKA